MNVTAGWLNKISKYADALWFIVLALVIFGVKVLFIENYGSPVPFWDQWDAEADILYRQYLNSHLSIATLISPHNEHRIVATRILSVFLFELNGGWDPILQMLINSLLHVAAIISLVMFCNSIVEFKHRVLLIAFTICLFSLPIGWENMLAGFQSQFYFLLFFSLAAFSFLLTSPVFSARWWVGFVCLIGSYFSMASGLLTAVVVLVIVVSQILFQLRKGRRELIAAGLITLVAAGMAVKLHHVSEHDVLMAQSFSEFIRAFLIYVAFPFSNPLAALLSLCPMVIYMWLVLSSRPLLMSQHWTVFAIAVWLIAQSVALAYGRAAAISAPRYLDIIIFALPLNFAALSFVQGRGIAVGRLWGASLILPSWSTLIVAGLFWSTYASSMPSVIDKGRQGSEQFTNVTKFLNSGDPADIRDKPMLAIPYPDPKRLAALLSDPMIRLELPKEIRPAEIAYDGVFKLTFLKARLSEVVNVLKLSTLNHGMVFVMLGLALATFLIFGLRNYSPHRIIRDQ